MCYPALSGEAAAPPINASHRAIACEAEAHRGCLRGLANRLSPLGPAHHPHRLPWPKPARHTASSMATRLIEVSAFMIAPDSARPILSEATTMPGN